VKNIYVGNILNNLKQILFYNQRNIRNIYLTRNAWQAHIKIFLYQSVYEQHWELRVKETSLRIGTSEERRRRSREHLVSRKRIHEMARFTWSKRFVLSNGAARRRGATWEASRKRRRVLKLMNEQGALRRWSRCQYSTYSRRSHDQPSGWILNALNGENRARARANKLA